MKSLEELKKKTDKPQMADGPKREFLTLKDGDQYRIRFRQELTEDSDNYDEERGTALVVGVHSYPLDFKKRLGCTSELEEYNFQCWSCEQVSENNKWRAQTRFYINVAVENAGEWIPKLIEQGFGKSHIGNALVEFATEYGSIVDREYKFKRTGSGLSDTSYSLTPLKEGDESDDLKKIELLSFDGLVRYLPYDEQQAYYLGQIDPSKAWKD